VTAVTDYAQLSYWHDSAAARGEDLSPRASLPGDQRVDVAIIGAGLTGLWTAWYLLQQAPGTSVALIEREIAGFGASGRNGGWASALFPKSAGALERLHGRDAAIRMRQAMIDTVDEVGRAAAAVGVDADYAKGGTVLWARSVPQERAARADVAAAQAFGVDPIMWLDDVGSGVAGARGAAFDPSCARVHPTKLTRGMARAIEALGGRIYERTTAIEVRGAAQGQRPAVVTDRGTVTAERVIVATEGYTPQLPGWRRRILPLYSLMVATEPLSDAFWDEIGIAHGQTFCDYRHLLIYGQRTADNRIAFGGRGARYHLGSAIKPEYDRVPRVFEHLRRAIEDLFPAARGVAITHTWGGNLGVPRDWHASVWLDRRSGVGFAGGYVGDGLSTTNLAGRTLADLILDRETELTALPWVGHRSPSWELEPLRFLGANAGLVATGLADREERITQRPSIIAKLVAPLTGH